MSRVRERWALVDRADRCAVRVAGDDRLAWLHSMLSADLRPMIRGEAQRAAGFLLDATGHVTADVAVAAIPGEDALLLDLPADAADTALAVLDRFLIAEDVEIDGDRAAWTCWSVQGPGAGETVVPAGAFAVPADQTGSGGVDLYAPAGGAAGIIKALGPPIAAEAAEALRIEAGLPRWGAELDASVLAPEADPAFAGLSLTKGCYLGQEVVARISARGHTNRALAGFVVEAGEVAAGATLRSAGEPGKDAGRITSVCMHSPAAGGRTIALGYARHEHSEPGSTLETENGATVTVARLPFYGAARS